MARYPYGTVVVFDPVTKEKAPTGSLGDIYAPEDTAFTSPLAAYDLNGQPGVALVSNQDAFLPYFESDLPWVKWKSGEYVFSLVTDQPLPGPAGEQGIGVQGVAASGDQMVVTLTDGTQLAPVPLPTAPGGSNAGVAEYINVEGPTRDALSATIAEELVDAPAVAAKAPRFGSRPFHAAWRVAGETAEELPLLSNPPTITTGTANLDTALTKSYRWDTSPDVFRICGGTPTPYFTSYVRAPVVTLPQGVGNASATRNGYTWFYEFESTSQKVMIHMIGSNTPGLKIEVDGQKVSNSVVPYPGTTGDAYFLIANTASAPRHYRVWVERNAAFMRVFVGPNETVSRPRRIPVRLAVLGDSIAASAGSTARPDGNFASLLGKRMGWDDVRQIALGGTGFVSADATYNSKFGDATRLADLAEANPGVILVSATPNDNANTPAAITAAVLSTLQAYRTTAPTALIIVAGLIPPAGGVAAATLANENATKAAFDQWADPNSMWIPVSTDPDGAWSVPLADGVHPDSAGHETMAMKLTMAIRSRLV